MSDYAQAQGTYKNMSYANEINGWWWLRSPSDSSASYASSVRYFGLVGNDSGVMGSQRGVVPALTIMLS